MQLKYYEDDIYLFGRYLRTLRQANGLSIRALADKMKCSHSLISEVEKGNQQPSDDMLKRVAKALKGDHPLTEFKEALDGCALRSRLAHRLRLIIADHKDLDSIFKYTPPPM